MVDEAGGSLLVEPPDVSGIAGIRLALAAPAAAEQKPREEQGGLQCG
jgi:hypothetical protein